MRPWLNLLFAVLALTTLPCPAPAWFGNSTPTLREGINAAHVVIYGTLRLATPPNPSRSNEGATDFSVEKVLKGRAAVAGQKILTVRDYIPATGRGPVKYLIFGYANKGKLTYYAGLRVQAGEATVKYLEGLLRVKGDKPAKRLLFYFDHLHHPDCVIANDAFEEVARADYRDYREATSAYSGNKVAAWVRDPKASGWHLALYAEMLGYCSKDREGDSRFLRSLLTGRRSPSEVGGILKGLLLLQPEEGWKQVCRLLGDRSLPVQTRFAAYATARFLMEFRPDLLPRQKVIAGVSLLLDQPDICDVAIEDLRLWSCWALTPRILALKHKPSHDTPLIHRAILGFALCSPEKQAAAYVAVARRENAQAVADLEELLKLEQQKPAKN